MTTECPKCGCPNIQPVEICRRCGVIFSKIRNASNQPVDSSGRSITIPVVMNNLMSLVSRVNRRAVVVTVMSALALVSMVLIYKVHEARKLARVPVMTIDPDNGERITTSIDESGNKQVMVEPIGKPRNEAERLAIAASQEKMERITRERRTRLAAEKRARMTPEELEAERKQIELDNANYRSQKQIEHERIENYSRNMGNITNQRMYGGTP